MFQWFLNQTLDCIRSCPAGNPPNNPLYNPLNNPLNNPPNNPLNNPQKLKHSSMSIIRCLFLDRDCRAKLWESQWLGILIIGQAMLLLELLFYSTQHYFLSLFQVYYSHMNFVYGVAVLPHSDGFVSVSEDRSLKVWRGGECVQTITHPCTSVWSVCVLDNGDIVTGSRYIYLLCNH